MQKSDKQPLKLFDIANQQPVAVRSSTQVQKEADSTVFCDPNRQSINDAALEVDRFAWPPLCMALDETAKTVAAPIVDAISSAADSGRRVILITSGARQSGRTTTAIWLAATCALTNRRIALIDADVEKPSIAQLLGIQPPAGWEDFSTKDQPLGEYLIDSIADRFTVLPCTFDASLTQWPHLWDLASIFEFLRDQYDVILVDVPPLERRGLGSEMLADCGPFIDAALWLDTHPVDTMWAQAQLHTAGVPLLGLIQRAPLAAQAA